MRIEEINEVIGALAKLDFASMDITDQMAYILADNQFAEKMKLIVAKYSDKLPKKTTFLFKM